MNAKFDLYASEYSDKAVVQKQMARWLAEWLEPCHRTKALEAVEIGSGTGIFTRFLARSFTRVVGVDTAPSMIEIGKKYLPSVDWLNADGWYLRIPPIDRLFSSSVLHWCVDPLSVLVHWKNIVKRGGRILHGFYVEPTLSELWQLIDCKYPVQWKTPVQWQAYFEEAGWKLLRSESKTHFFSFDSSLALFRFLHRTGAVVSRKFTVGEMRRVLVSYDQRFSARDGTAGVISTWTFFRIEAVNH